MKGFHYTSGQGLFGIITSKKLHCTNQKFLNDPSELTYANSKIEEVLKSNHSFNDIYQNLINSSFQDNVVAPFDIYISSFSQNSDSLNLWKYYSQGNGYNLELDLEQIIKQNNGRGFAMYKFKIIYHENEQKILIREFFNKFKEDNKKYVTLSEEIKISRDDKSAYSELITKTTVIVERFNRELWKLKMNLKHKAYEDEKEIRLVISEDKFFQNSSQFKVTSKGIIVDYIELNLDLIKTLNSVTLHPINNTALHKNGVEKLMLKEIGFNSIPLISSDLPFREL